MSEKNNPNKPTESELEILQILWEHGPNTVRFVNDELSKTKETGYTTTLKLMQIMHEKAWYTAMKPPAATFTARPLPNLLRKNNFSIAF